ncbi:MAG: hypothetical protein Q7S21_03490 [archaeon]|nr:hypothetical protein [archaeon]
MIFLSRAERRQKEKGQEVQAKNNTLLFSGIAVGVILIIGFFLIFGNASSSTVGGITFPTGQVHWHAYPSVEICGEVRQLPLPSPGQSHLGSDLLHTHDDGWIHVEGKVNSPQEITLGQYMQNIGVKFSSTQLWDKTNGDLCNGVAGKVQLFINGIENSELENHVIKDQEKVLFKFG